jgi:hypothetical protein
VNAGFLNAAGERRVTINPRCKHLINDLQIMSYKEKTSELEKYDGTDIGHASDGLGYVIFVLMPIELKKSVAPQILSRR